MKKLLFPAVLAFISVQTNAQEIFAITGKQTPQIIFNDLRAINSNGTSGEILFSENAASNVFSQSLQTNITESKSTIHNAQTPSMAALAFDVNSNSMLFVPMFSSNIYVMNNRTKQITLVENQAIKSVACNVESHITRMAATKDGTVYAMSNSGSQLIKISNENGRYSVQDLGAVKDKTPNSDMSISKMLTGFGGDMVADAQNNLYVFSAFNNVFKVNVEDLSAEFVGTITGLPEKYNINGTAVNATGNVVVGNARGEGLYEVNMKSLEAKPISGGFNLPIYDLASSYFLNDTAAANENTLFTGISIYPTKINQQNFNVKIDNEAVKGNLTVEMIDYMGNKVAKQNINVIRNHSEFKIDFKKMNAGVYVININDASGKVVFNTKVLVEK
jgi:hypothetical protein